MSREKYDLGLSFFDIVPQMMEMQGIKQLKEFAELIERKQQDITPYKTGRYKGKPIPPKWIFKFLDKTKYSLEELLGWRLGKGKPENGGGSALEQSLQTELIIALYAEEGLRQTGGVKKFVMEVPKTYIEAGFKENKHNLIAWVMNADNMDPFIRRNEALIIDNRFKEIKGDGIYAFRNQEGKIKICRVCERLEGGIDIVNDNRAYESHRGPMLGSNISKLEILGRVVGFYRDI